MVCPVLGLYISINNWQQCGRLMKVAPLTGNLTLESTQLLLKHKELQMDAHYSEEMS